MIRPGIMDPRQGANRTQQMRQRLQAMLRQRAAMPRLGGLSRRPVAGPGVRSFGGAGGSLHPAALQALTNRLSNAVIPMQSAIPGLPPQSQPGGLDTLPDPAAGSGPGAFYPEGFLSQGPNQPLRFPNEALGLNGPTAPAGGDLAGQIIGTGLDTLIPLGGGAYYDTSTGQINAPGRLQAV